MKILKVALRTSHFALRDSRGLISRFSILPRRAIGLFLVTALICAPASLASNSSHEPDPAILIALQERFGLNEEEVIRRLAAQRDAIPVYETLKEALGEAYAGAWFDGGRLRLVVAITKPELADMVLAEEAHPVVVERGLADLQIISDRLREEITGEEWLEAVTGWYIDYQSNSVVVEVLPEGWNYVASRLPGLELDSSSIRLEASPGRGQVLADILGGDPYNNVTEGGGCSIGFSVEGGYITAGHCGWSNHAVTGFNGQAQGNFAGSTYPPTIWCEPEIGQCWVEPNRDLAWVSTSSGWTPQPRINQYSGNYPVWVTGTMQPPVGYWVCRYGRTTGGPHCGTLQAYDQTVHLFDPNFGMSIPFVQMIKVDVCAEEGDSGGPLVYTLWWNFNGNQIVKAVGTLTGGSVGSGCPGSNNQMYFATVNNQLNEFNLTLVTQQ